jgi:hypothetical protein
MPASYKKRRAREKPIEVHLRWVKRRLIRICQEAGCSPDGRLHLAREALEFADPWGVPGRDALLPAHRVDLLDIWLRLCVTTQLTREEREMAARQLGPAPDLTWEDPAPPDAPGYREVRDACRSRRRRRKLPPHTPTFTPRDSLRVHPTRGRAATGGPERDARLLVPGSQSHLHRARQRPGRGSHAERKEAAP